MSIFTLEQSQYEIKRNEVRNQTEYRKWAIIAFASALVVAYKQFWNNNIVTPQEQCDILWEQAPLLFQKHSSGVVFVLENIPDITDYIPDFMEYTHVPTNRTVSIEGGVVTIWEIEEEVIEQPTEQPIIEENIQI